MPLQPQRRDSVRFGRYLQTRAISLWQNQRGKFPRGWRCTWHSNVDSYPERPRKMLMGVLVAVVLDPYGILSAYLDETESNSIREQLRLR